MTSTTTAGAPPGDDAIDLDRHDRSPGTGTMIALLVTVLVLGAAVGWRVGRTQGEPEFPGAGSVDVGFFQDMSTHHNQGVTMGLDYLRNGTDPLLRTLATEIVTYQSSEIGIMGEYLAQWGESGTQTSTAMTWMGMATPRDQMAGLATDTEMRELGAARGLDLDQLFTRLMILHHAGGIHMAEVAARTAGTAEVRRWASSMDHGQRGEIAELNRWRVNHDMAAVDPGLT